MAFCNKCGAQLEEGTKFCASCGQPTGAKETINVDNVVENLKALNNTADTTAQYEQSDIENNKIIALFAYIGILFLIPLLGAPNSKFARFHANQGIVYFLASLALGLVCTILGFIPVVGAIIGAIAGLVDLVFMILGIYNAVTGKAKELPFIGSIKIL
jgi:uncharacterized membrane protein